MKNFLLVFFLLQGIAGMSQLKNKLGTVMPEEISLKQCAFDPEADAVILYDEGFSDYGENYDLITYRYKKIKILKESGIKYADLVIDYRSGHSLEDIIAVEAMVTNPDENGLFTQTQVERKAVYKTKINENWSRLTMAIPQVRAGSIIEYTYRIQAKHWGMLRDWEFQSDIPVYRSAYNLRIVPNVEMSYMLQFTKKLEPEVKPDKNSGSVFFSMQNIPALTDEPYMDSRADYIQKVIFQITKIGGQLSARNYMSTWDEVHRELNGRPDFGRQLRVNIDECSAFIASMDGKSDYQKMEAVYRYVQKNTNWNGRYGVITTDGVKNLWKSGTGSAAEINLSLVNLLNRVGLKALPALVSERGNGRINKTSPFIDQFNNVYASVLINDRRYFLDATDKFNPPYLVPSGILNTTAFIVASKNGGLVDVEENKLLAKDIVAVNGTITENGAYSGKVQIISSGYSRCEWLRNFRRQKRDEYISSRLLNGMGNVQIDSLDVKNVEEDTLDLRQYFIYKTNLQSTGEYTFLGVNMFTDFQHNPFINPNRFSTINFGFSKSTYLNSMVNLPENFTVDALPKSIKMKNEDGSVMFSREMFHDAQNRRLVARIKVEISRSVFTVDEYPALREFYKKMIEMMNEQVVLKKI